MFLPTMTRKRWQNTVIGDLVYHSIRKKRRREPAIVAIPFYSMGQSEIETIIKWLHIDESVYKMEHAPYASALQWVAAIESLFTYVIYIIITFFICIIITS